MEDSFSQNRFLKVLFLRLGFLVIPSLCFAQNDQLFKLWPDSVLARANSASDVAYMSEEEKKVIFYINLCRINPPLFEQTYLKDHLKQKKIKSDKSVKELQAYLKNTASKKLLEPSESLTNTARMHAQDMGKTGRTGHNASSGATFQERISVMLTEYRGVNENTSYGLSEAMDIVVDLLIDRNVPNAGHRKNILDAEMRFIGVAIEPHIKWGKNCVQDFGGERLRP